MFLASINNCAQVRLASSSNGGELYPSPMTTPSFTMTEPHWARRQVARWAARAAASKKGRMVFRALPVTLFMYCTILVFMHAFKLEIRTPSPLALLVDDRLNDAGVTLYLKRDDLISPEIPGNKWRKLKYNLEEARQQGYTTLLTFGGAYSNHLRAVAAAGERFGFATIGIVRGEEHTPLNWSLAYAAGRGMQLEYMDRETYRRKKEAEVVEALCHRFGEFYLVPEGGSNELAVRGCAEITAEIDVDFDVICCPVGTGGTLAGIAASLAPHQRAIGFSSLKGGEFLDGEVEDLQQQAYGRRMGDWRIEARYHFGGFAKVSAELREFAADFERRHGVVLETTYVAKMLYGVFDMVARGEFARGAMVVAVVTGVAE